MRSCSRSICKKEAPSGQIRSNLFYAKKLRTCLRYIFCANPARFCKQIGLSGGQSWPFNRLTIFSCSAISPRRSSTSASISSKLTSFCRTLAALTLSEKFMHVNIWKMTHNSTRESGILAHNSIRKPIPPPSRSARAGDGMVPCPGRSQGPCTKFVFGRTKTNIREDMVCFEKWLQYHGCSSFRFASGTVTRLGLGTVLLVLRFLSSTTTRCRT